MNVIDAVHRSDAIAIGAIAQSSRTGQQETVCSSRRRVQHGNPLVKNGPPPIGGDEPGFFTSGDLPPAGPSRTCGHGRVELPKDDFLGSQCEGVNWATIAAKSKKSGLYLIQESGKNFFGLNEVVLTMKRRQSCPQAGRGDQVQSFGLQDPKAHSNGYEAQEGD